MAEVLGFPPHMWRDQGEVLPPSIGLVHAKHCGHFVSELVAVFVYPLHFVTLPYK